jgi:hypothetical protein
MDWNVKQQLERGKLSREATENLPRLAHASGGWLERVNQRDDVAYIADDFGYEAVADRAFAAGKRVRLYSQGALRQ